MLLCAPDKEKRQSRRLLAERDPRPQNSPDRPWLPSSAPGRVKSLSGKEEREQESDGEVDVYTR